MSWENSSQRKILDLRRLKGWPLKHISYSSKRCQLSEYKEPGEGIRQSGSLKDMSFSQSSKGNYLFPLKFLVHPINIRLKLNNFLGILQKINLNNRKLCFALNNILEKKFRKTEGRKDRKLGIFQILRNQKAVLLNTNKSWRKWKLKNFKNGTRSLVSSRLAKTRVRNNLRDYFKS